MEYWSFGSRTHHSATPKLQHSNHHGATERDYLERLLCKLSAYVCYSAAC
jgi:hypothetical protein